MGSTPCPSEMWILYLTYFLTGVLFAEVTYVMSSNFINWRPNKDTLGMLDRVPTIMKEVTFPSQSHQVHDWFVLYIFSTIQDSEIPYLLDSLMVHIIFSSISFLWASNNLVLIHGWQPYSFASLHHLPIICLCLRG